MATGHNRLDQPAGAPRSWRSAAPARRPLSLPALAVAAIAAGLALGGLPPGVGAAAPAADRATSVDAQLAPLIEHQREEHFHKASSGYFELIQGGLPRRDSVLIRQRLAECLQAIGLSISAGQVYYEALRLGTDLPEYGAVMTAWVAHARGMAGAPLYAVDTLSELPEQFDPLDLEPLRFLRGLGAFRAGDDGRALVAFEDISEDKGLQARAAFLAGVIYARQGVQELAEERFLAALTAAHAAEGDPTAARLGGQIQLDLARLAYARGDLARARAGYSAAEDPGARRELAWALLRADHTREAWELAASLRDAAVWPPDVNLLLALTYQRAGEKRASKALLDGFRDGVKADSARIGAFLARHPRKDAEGAAAEVLALDGAPAVAEADRLPAALVAHLLQDWRLRAAREQIHAAEAELAKLSGQLEWWRERALGKHLPGLVTAVAQQTQRQAGLRILGALESEQQALDRLAVESLILNKSRGKEALGPLSAWDGPPLPDWPPAEEPPAPEEGEEG